MNWIEEVQYQIFVLKVKRSRSSSAVTVLMRWTTFWYKNEYLKKTQKHNFVLRYTAVIGTYWRVYKCPSDLGEFRSTRRCGGCQKTAPPAGSWASRPWKSWGSFPRNSRRASALSPRFPESLRAASPDSATLRWVHLLNKNNYAFRGTLP